MKRRILVLCHRHSKLRYRYMMWTMVQLWRTEGHEVLVHSGDRDVPDADIVFVHLDITLVPQSYLEAVAKIPIQINSRVRDISKRVISRGLVNSEDSYQGPVVVKSDLNHLGTPELLLSMRRGNPLAWGTFAFRRFLPTRWTGLPPGGNYVIYDSKSAVPAWVWQDKRLVVERFTPEKQGDIYVTHQWHFCGDEGVVSTLGGPNPIVQTSTTTHRLLFSWDVPDAIRQRREELGMGFGKIDYVNTPDGPILLDVTRTSASGQIPPSKRWREIGRLLAPGLDSFFAKAP